MSEWKGQNQRTLAIGWFPASLAAPYISTPSKAPNPTPAPPSASYHISAPLKGSLHHAGHGDIRPERNWGTPERLEM